MKEPMFYHGDQWPPSGYKGTIRTIVIKLCDNDFGNTFKPLLKSVYEVIKYHNFEMDKETVKQMILDSIRHYLTYWQNYDRRHADPSPSQSATYLIDHIKIFFDEEAEKIIETSDDDHGSWYLQVCTGEVYSF